MTTWDFRILAFVDKRRPEESYFECRTVYYTEGVPTLFCEEGTTLYGMNKKSLRWQLNAMKEAMTRPILWGGERFPKKYKRLKKKVE